MTPHYQTKALMLFLHLHQVSRHHAACSHKGARARRIGQRLALRLVTL